MRLRPLDFQMYSILGNQGIARVGNRLAHLNEAR